MSDYISRKAAKEAFGNADADVCESYPDGHCDWGFGRSNINAVIDGIPAADEEPVRHWIPRSERMPEVDDYYLCVYHFDGHKKERISTFFCYATDPNPHFQDENHHGLKVTHWMPLPEPPEEGGKGK